MDCKNVLTLQKQKITNVDLSLNLFFFIKDLLTSAGYKLCGNQIAYNLLKP